MRNVKDKTKTTAKAEEPLLEARIDARCVDPRVLKLMDGKSIKEIAAEEGVAYLTVYDSIEFVKKKIKNFFQDT